MNQKKAEYIALYSLVFGVILVFGILIRQFVLSKGIDDFSSTVAFFATVIVLTALYASLQITFNQFLLLKKQSPNLQNMKSCAPMLLQKRIVLFKPD